MKVPKWLKKEEYIKRLGALEFLKYLGPGILVTVGFIDPGNWASNIAAGSGYGYKLLWMVTLSTIMLIILQHNAAHLGIVTGLCISEALNKYLPNILAKFISSTAILAAIGTAMAEILGGAIALKMLLKIPLHVGAVIIAGIVLYMTLSNSYKKIEKIIIGFVSLIGLAFLFEVAIIDVNWGEAIHGWTTPSFPIGALPIIMSVLGAVVMPHNLFLHSEIIQSRQWNLQDEEIMEKQLKYEFMDTLLSMLIGWAINSAMILVAVTFFINNVHVTELESAKVMLEPLLGNAAAIIFALSLLFAGISSSVTASMAGASIYAGMFEEPFDIKDRHTKAGVLITICSAVLIIFFISNPFKGLVYSQMLLSVQLPITIFTQIYLTSSQKVMGKFKNNMLENFTLYIIGGIVSVLNIILLISMIFGK